MRNIKYIMIHHSAVEQPNINLLIKSLNDSHYKRKLHVTKNSLGNYTAYHYIIGIDGEVVQTRSNEEIGNHGSNKEINEQSIGICLSGNFDVRKPYDKQIESLLNLVLGLKKLYGDDIKVIYHRDYAKKTCPGKLFPYDLFNKQVNIMSKFKKVFQEEVTNPIFAQHDDKEQATIADVKYLIEIGISRATKRLITYINEENKKERSLIGKILSYFKF